MQRILGDAGRITIDAHVLVVSNEPRLPNLNDTAGATKT